jgi:hypothetical protein
LGSVGLTPARVLGRSGKDALLRALQGYNAAARHLPWFVLMDLDNINDCAGQVRGQLLPDQAPHMCFRIAVVEVEAWILADNRNTGEFLGVSPALLPLDPDALPDPKQALVNLARRSSRRVIREGLAPRPGSGTSIGPTYVSDLREYALSKWDPHEAALNSPSLARALSDLRRLTLR